MLALQSGAYEEAIVHLRRARDLLRLPLHGAAVRAAAERSPRGLSRLDPNRRVDPGTVGFRLGMVEGGLMEAHFRLGDLKACIEHAERALTDLGGRVPSTRLGWSMSVVRQVALRALQAFCRIRSDDPSRARRVASEVARVQLRYTETCYYSLRPLPLIWSTLRLVNHCEPPGTSPDLARAYVLLALLVSTAPATRFADRLCRRALAIAERAGTRHDVAWVLSRVSVFGVATCRWDVADAALGRASAIAEEIGDLRLWEEARAQIGALSLYTGQFERGHALYSHAHRLSRRSGNRQVECWALMGQGDVALRLGRSAEALEFYVEAAEKLDHTAMRTECVWAFGMIGLARLRLGDERGAYEAADRALAYVLAARPVAYWTQHGTAAIAEVLVSLLERRGRFDAGFQPTLAVRARQACAGLRRFARRFPLGRPHALLWEGLEAWVHNRRLRALRLWRRTVALAEQLGTPYEGGRAHLEIGRHLPIVADRRAYHLHRAVEVFEALGCPVELAAARGELARGAP